MHLWVEGRYRALDPGPACVSSHVSTVYLNGRADLKHAVDSVDARSMSAVILRMWLGDLDQNSLSVLLGADFFVPGDWMFLALSAMG